MPPHDHGLLWIFTKPAIAGRVKTRLVGELTAEEAALLHEAFLLDMVDRMEGRGFEVRLAWSLEEGEAVPEGPLPGEPQVGSDLGDRLFSALSRRGELSRYVAAVGSDHPELSPERVEEAFQRLAGGADLVIGPATDGGYYLVAGRSQRLRRELFEGIEWSSPRVLGQTLERAQRLGLTTEILPEEDDVDQPEDLDRLARRLGHDPTPCPRTAALLQRRGGARARGRNWRSGSAEETRSLGRELAEELLPDGTLLLHGDLGSGKTVLAQGVAQGLGIDPAQVQSPSFVLIREHRGTRGSLCHVDLYRIESSELAAIGLEETLADPGVKVVEWAERIDFRVPAHWRFGSPAWKPASVSSKKCQGPLSDPKSQNRSVVVVGGFAGMAFHLADKGGREARYGKVPVFGDAGQETGGSELPVIRVQRFRDAVGSQEHGVTGAQGNGR